MLVVVFVMMLGTALLLGFDRVGSIQEEGQHQESQEDELMVEKEHDEQSNVATIGTRYDGGSGKSVLQ